MDESLIFCGPFLTPVVAHKFSDLELDVQQMAAFSSINKPSVAKTLITSLSAEHSQVSIGLLLLGDTLHSSTCGS